MASRGPDPSKPDGERPRQYIAPLAAGASLIAPAAFAVLAHRVILFASLGPTAVMQAQAPERRSSAAYSVVVSHVAGFGVASAAVILLGLAHAPSVFQAGTVTPRRAIAAVAALACATAAEIALRAPHPPAGSTTLLVALGSFKPTWPTFMTFLLGVLSVAAAGEVIRQFRMRRPRS